VQVRRQIGSDIVLVADDGLQIHWRGVVERGTGGTGKERIDADSRELALRRLLKHGLLRRLKNAVHTPQNRKRENHLAVFVGFVLATQQVRHGPNERGKIHPRMLPRWALTASQ
jgi:hypothetical protein